MGWGSTPQPPLGRSPWSPVGIRVGGSSCFAKGRAPRGGGRELHSAQQSRLPPHLQTRRDLQSPPASFRGMVVVGPARSGQVGGSTFPRLPLPYPPALGTRCHPEHCRKMWLQQKPPQKPGARADQGRGARNQAVRVTHRAGEAVAAAGEPRSPSAAAASWFAHNPPGPGAAAASGAGREGGRKRGREEGGGGQRRRREGRACGPGGGRGWVARGSASSGCGHPGGAAGPG